MKKRLTAIVLAVAMIAAMMPMALAAGEYSDTQGHWGEAAIDRWTQAGVAEGRADGTFGPNDMMTREETAQMFVNLLHLTKEADISQYTDLDPASPYYQDFAKCVAAGIFDGTSANTMSPSSELTREQLFTTFARALGIQPAATSNVTFEDGNQVSSWAAGYINALANMGAVRGVGDGSLQPKADINRASVMSVLDQTISVYANTSGATVGESTGIVLVVADQVNVMGDVENLVVADGSASVTGSTVASVFVIGDKAVVNVSGSAAVTAVAVSGEGAQVNVSGQAQVGSVTVTTAAAGAAVNVSGSAVVNAVDAQANNVTIAGDGTVNSAVVSGSNTTVNTTGTDLTVSQGTTGVTQNGSAVSGGSTVETKPSTPTTPSNPTTPPVYIPNYYTVAFQYADGTAISDYIAVEYSAAMFPEVPCEEGQKVTWYENGTLVADTSNVIVTSNRTFTAVVGSDDFTAGNGTQQYPYLVANAEQFYAIDSLADDMLAGNSYYFKQTADIVGLTTGVDYLRGTYDGGGYDMRAITGAYKGVVPLFQFTLGDTVIKNIDTFSTSSVGVAITYMACTGVSLTIDNCNAYVDATDNTLRLENVGNFGFLIYYSIYDAKGTEDSYNVALESEQSLGQVVTLSNCTVNGNVQNTGNCTAAFIGQGFFPYDGNHTKLVMINCTNNGDVLSNLCAGLITGNYSYVDAANAMISSTMGEDEKVAAFNEYYVIQNVVNNGDIQAVSNTANFIAAPSNTSDWVNQHLATVVINNGMIGKQGNALANMDLKLYSDGTNYYVNNAEYMYKVAFKISAINIDGGASNSRDVLIDLETYSEESGAELVKTGSNIHAYDADTAVEKGIISQDEANELTYSYLCEGHKVDIVVKEDNTYIIFNTESVVSVDSSVTTYIYGYDASMNLVGSKVINQQ